MTNRRRFLEALAAAGAASLAPSAGVFGQQRGVKLNVRGGAIDVHHHFVPPGGATNRPWSPQMSLEQMDAFGIGVAILSMTQNGELLYNGTEKGRAAVRAGNEYGATLMQQYPKKFGLMGGIPMPDLEGSLREVEYAYDTLKVDAIGIYTNDNHGRWPGDPYFEPLWQELNRRNAIVYMHPLAPRLLQRPEIRRCGQHGGIRLRCDARRHQPRGQRRHVSLSEHPIHHRPFRRHGADARRPHERPHPTGRRAVPAKRAICRAAQVVLRHCACKLSVAVRCHEGVHAGVTDPFRDRLRA